LRKESAVTKVRAKVSRLDLEKARLSEQFESCNRVTSFGSVDFWKGHTETVAGLHLRELFFEVPMAYRRGLEGEGGDRIVIFAREVLSSRRPIDNLPYLLYLQGGPGFESPRPLDSSGWLEKACESFRVILLDQRGTGRSTPITTASLKSNGAAEENMEYLKYHRASSIVTDAEVIRQCLNQSKWSILGQSFGGFCCLSYLSMFPTALEEVFIMGGLPPIEHGCTAHRVYKALFKRVQLQNQKYYERFPQDRQKISDVFDFLHKAGPITTPAGNSLTTRSLQALGIRFGGATGLETIHYMFESAFEESSSPERSQLAYKFLKDYDSMVSIDTNVLYALLHESIYCQGASSNWAAEQVRKEYEAKECPNFDVKVALEEDLPIYFTGEMIFPWMFKDIAQLRPLRETAERVANRCWPSLYDEKQLGANEVPVAAAVYVEDMYVDLDLSLQTASKIKGIRTFVTNEYLHSGIRENGGKILEKLMNLARNVEPLR
jgi:pimeloyl-ACP methyl ester carboxylesterase